MSRNAEEGIALYMDLFDKGVNLVFLKEQFINTDNYRNQIERNNLPTTDDRVLKPVLEGIKIAMIELAKIQIEIAFEQAQKEVDDLGQRTREGIAQARLNGKQIGAIAGKSRKSSKEDMAKEIIKQHSKDFFGTLKDTEVIKLAEINRNTYYKYKKELAEEINNNNQ